MVCDFLRSHHLAPTQFHPDSADKTWLRWYPTVPGARSLGLWSAFGNPVWESDFPVPDGVGCSQTPLVWRGKRYPAPPGQHYRGLPEWFQDGLPLADRATPPIDTTCTAAALSPIGGVLIGGQAWPAAPVVGSHPCVCASPTTGIATPGFQPAAACLCASPLTTIVISGTQSVAPCLCASPETEVVFVIQSCLTQTLTSGSLDNLVLVPTSTPITKYDLTAVSGGSTITGIVPQNLLTGPQWIELVNVTANPITIVSGSTSSLAANRVQLPPTYNGAVTLQKWDTITLSQNPCGTPAQWVVQACTVDLDNSLASILTYIQANYSPVLPSSESILLVSKAITPVPGDLGLTPLTLAAGTWLLHADAQLDMQCQTVPTILPLTGQVTLQIHDGAGAVLNAVDSPIDWNSNSANQQNSYSGSGHLSLIHVVAATTTLTLWAAFTSTTNSTASIIGDPSNSPTRLWAVRIS